MYVRAAQVQRPGYFVEGGQNQPVGLSPGHGLADECEFFGYATACEGGRLYSDR